MPLSLGVFEQLAVILLITVGIGALAAVLKQPLLVAFIIVGVIVGPSGVDIVGEGAQLELLSNTGIAILLFIVGLSLDVQTLRSVGVVAVAAGVAQVVFTATVGFLVALVMGFSVIAATYIGIGLTLSSAIIIVKLLNDKREIDALHGRIAVGVLLVQDVLAIIAMIVLAAIAASGAHGPADVEKDAGLLANVVLVLVKGFGLLLAVFVLMQWVLPHVTRALARSQELLVLFSIAWAVTMAVAGERLGFSREVGAFLAGVSLAPTPFRHAIGARLVSVRDFTLLFFFVALGADLRLDDISAHLGAAAVFTMLVIVANPVVVLIVMGLMGYRKRTGFLTGITSAQIGHFSLIIAAMGVQLQHIDEPTAGLITIVCLTTIVACTYAVLYSHQLYERLSPMLSIFERATPHREQSDATVRDVRTDAIVFGLGRFGSNIGRRLRDHGMRVLGVDFDPQAVRQWCAHGGDAQYGDAEDPEFAASLPLANAEWVVCSVPQLAISRIVMHTLRERGFAGRIALTAHNHADARTLKELGADLVLLPFVDAAERAAQQIIERRDNAERNESLPEG